MNLRTREYLISEFKKLPESKREIFDKENEFLGMWKNRSDMENSTKWVENLRQSQWNSPLFRKR